MFIIILTYIKPLAEIDNYLQEHRKFLDKNYDLGNFIASGRRNPRTGGIILCRAKNTEDVNLIINEDPFNKNKIASYEVIEFEATKYAKGFENYL